MGSRVGTGTGRNSNARQIISTPGSDFTSSCTAGSANQQADTKSTVQQGYIEKSNVNSVGEMSRMVEVMRSYTAIANLLQQQSDMHKSAIEKLADVPA